MTDLADWLDSGPLWADGFKTGSGYAPAMRQATKRYAPSPGTLKSDKKRWPFGREPFDAASFHIGPFDAASFHFIYFPCFYMCFKAFVNAR